MKRSLLRNRVLLLPISLPGAGKNTLYKNVLARIPSLRYLECSALLRGKYGQFDEKILLSNEKVWEVLLPELSRFANLERGMLCLDGAVRNTKQAQKMIEWARDYDSSLVLIHQEVDEEECIKRMLARSRSNETEEHCRERMRNLLPGTKSAIKTLRSETDVVLYLGINGNGTESQTAANAIERLGRIGIKVPLQSDTKSRQRIA